MDRLFQNRQEQDPEQGEESKAHATVEAAKDMLRSALRSTLVAGSAPEVPAEWTAFRNQYPGMVVMVVNKGRALGVSSLVLNQYVFEALQEEIAKQSYGVVARLLKNLNMGSPELIAMFEALHARREADLAAREQARADAAEKGETVELPPADSATMADLYRVLRTLGDEAQDAFESEIADGYRGLLERFIDLEQDSAKAGATKVTDFFGEEPDDIEISLPLHFFKKRPKRRGNNA
jgi:hypothetical protein